MIIPAAEMFENPVRIAAAEVSGAKPAVVIEPVLFDVASDPEGGGNVFAAERDLACFAGRRFGSVGAE